MITGRHMTTENEPLGVAYHATDRGVVPEYEARETAQPAVYRAEDHDVWRALCRRQHIELDGRAFSLFLENLTRCSWSGAVPRFSDINELLAGSGTGWKIVAVNGLLSDVMFFEMLARRAFPVTWWIRTAQQIEYIQEPDLFHDLFGHVPLLLDPRYADMMKAFGTLGVQLSANPEAMIALGRIYWHTVEFGLIRDHGHIRAFGAGLMSSAGEIAHALSSDPIRRSFDIINASKTPYKIDAYQPKYFVLDGFDQLEDALERWGQRQRA